MGSPFAALKPLCVSLSQLAFAPPALLATQLPQLACRLDALATGLEQLEPDPTLTAALGDYVFVPVAHLLGTHMPLLSDTHATSVLRIVRVLVSRFWGTSGLALPLARQLVPLVAVLVGGKPDLDEQAQAAVVHAKPDALKLAAVACLEAVWNGVPSGDTHQPSPLFQDRDTVPMLGHTIAVLLAVISDATGRDQVGMFVASVQSLSTLFFLVLGSPEVLALVVPKTVLVATRLLATPLVRLAATARPPLIQLFSDLVTTVFDDESLGLAAAPVPRLLQDMAPVLGTAPVPPHSPNRAHPKYRTPEWRAANAKHVGAASVQIVVRQRDAQPAVARVLACSVGRWVHHCLVSLGAYVLLWLDGVALLNTDAAETVVATCSGTRLAPAITGRLEHGGRDHLARGLRSGVEGTVEDSLTVATFYLDVGLLLAAHIDPPVWRGILQQVVATVEDELLGMAVERLGAATPAVAVASTPTLELLGTQQPLQVFGLAYTAATEAKVACLVEHVARVWGDELLLGECVEQQLDHAADDPVGLWVAQRLVQSAAAPDEFLQLENDSSELALAVVDVAVESLASPATLKRIVALDALAAMAHTLAPQELAPELIHVLFPVVEAVASSDPAEQAHATAAIVAVAARLYPEMPPGQAVAALVAANTDYLTDAVSLRLTLSAVLPALPQVLGVLVQLGGLPLVERLGDVVDLMFLMLDMYHGYHQLTNGFFGVFTEVVLAIELAYPPQPPPVPENQHRPWGAASVAEAEAIVAQNSEAISQAMAPMADSDDEDDEEKTLVESAQEDPALGEEVPPEEPEPWLLPIPPASYRLLSRVFTYGIRLLPHPLLLLKTLVANTYVHVIPLLALLSRHWLPLVVQLWPVLLAVFKDASDLRVLVPLCTVLALVLDYSGLFMGKRFGELWGVLRNKPLVRDVLGNGSITTSALTTPLPPYQRQTYAALVSIVTTGLKHGGRALDTATVQDMVKACAPITTELGVYTDVLWLWKEPAAPPPFLPPCSTTRV